MISLFLKIWVQLSLIGLLTFFLGYFACHVRSNLLLKRLRLSKQEEIDELKRKAKAEQSTLHNKLIAKDSDIQAEQEEIKKIRQQFQAQQMYSTQYQQQLSSRNEELISNLKFLQTELERFCRMNHYDIPENLIDPALLSPISLPHTFASSDPTMTAEGRKNNNNFFSASEPSTDRSAPYNERNLEEGSWVPITNQEQFHIKQAQDRIIAEKKEFLEDRLPPELTQQDYHRQLEELEQSLSIENLRDVTSQMARNMVQEGLQTVEQLLELSNKQWEDLAALLYLDDPYTLKQRWTAEAKKILSDYEYHKTILFRQDYQFHS